MASLLELVRQYQEGEDLDTRMRAAEALLAEVGPRLRAFLSQSISGDEARDVFQETLVGITRNLHQFRGQTEASVWKWCYQVLRNKRNDRLRRRSKEPKPLDPNTLWEAVEASTRRTPMSPAERAELDEAMKLLRTLKPPCYEYVWQRLWLELDFAEIGRLHGKTADAARMTFGRCLKKARGLLGPEWEGS